MQNRLDPADFARAVMLESSSVPPHMTLSRWRRERRRAAAAARGRRRALRGLHKRTALA